MLPATLSMLEACAFNAEEIAAAIADFASEDVDRREEKPVELTAPSLSDNTSLSFEEGRSVF